jgi:hypothetical protein
MFGPVSVLRELSARFAINLCALSVVAFALTVPELQDTTRKNATKLAEKYRLILIPLFGQTLT